ncbi:MAG TPA: ferrochelatase [Candidatus Limnocylindrales bacterium]|nr:ferrochelatase [Candidatus Limnocylindrales bacterium]
MNDPRSGLRAHGSGLGVADRRGVLLMTYGSPADLDDVPRYLTEVRGGRAPEPDLVVEFTRRYRVIGGSPLVPITRRQAAALEARLGPGFRVEAGMRFSEPSIEAALRALAGDGAARVAGLILSPQYSPLLMGGYARAVEAAREQVGPQAPPVVVAEAWGTEPAFVAALAGRIRTALAEMAGGGADVPVLLTAHSLPRRVAEQEPGYLDQLEATATAVAEAAGLARGRWRFCWQSAGHEPGEWMKPDFADLMPLLRSEGNAAVLVAPVQFLADHLEILYDIDVGAREQAEAAGLAFCRIRSLDDDPSFIEALASVVERTLEGRPLGGEPSATASATPAWSVRRAASGRPV